MNEDIKVRLPFRILIHIVYGFIFTILIPVGAFYAALNEENAPLYLRLIYCFIGLLFAVVGIRCWRISTRKTK
jgi:hypothetical protein